MISTISSDVIIIIVVICYKLYDSQVLGQTKIKVMYIEVVSRHNIGSSNHWDYTRMICLS